MSETKTNSQKILILGGTQFMGKALLDLLAATKPQASVYCINRGKVHWNNQARRQHSYQHFMVDRNDHKDTIAMIKYLNQKLNISQQNKWKAIVDFSALKWRDIQSVIKGLGNMMERYIFISTDSIYNNQDEQQELKSPVDEDSFDVLKECLTQRKLSSIYDKYGYRKLKCEVYIKKRCQVPYYCLRLPDVIGPYDNTERFWTTVQWIKKSQQHKIPLNFDDQDDKLSFVYSVDVCRFIIHLIDIEKPQSDVIHIACKETPTFEKFIKMIGKQLGIQPVFKAVKKSSDNCYPSTSYGYMSTDKMTNKYNFQSTPLDQAIDHTVEFFTEKANNYKRQRSFMMQDLKKKIKQNQE